MSTMFSVKTLKSLLHMSIVGVGSVALTLGFFLVLPIMQAITAQEGPDTMLQTVTTADVPPPPPPIEEEPEPEEEPEEETPEVEPPDQQLELSQLELALQPGFGDNLVGDGAFTLKLSSFAAAGDQQMDELFSLSDLDQKPRVIYQPGPIVDGALKKKAPATVYIVFVVDQRGKVEGPLVQKSTDPAFERAALSAVKQWKFEPGKRNGAAVRFRMRVPITFPAES